MVASRTLGEACDSGDLALVESVLNQCQNDKTIDAQVRPRLGFFMSCAASNGHADIVRYLLDNGAEFRSSPLFASQHEETDKTIKVFNVLIDHGLDLKAYPDLIHSVASKGHKTALLKYLLLNGADPNALDHWERTPLELCDNSDAIIALINHGANVATGKALHNAAVIVDDSDCIERMKLLVEHGVDINTRAAYPAGTEPDPEAPGHDAYSDGMRRTGSEGTALHWAVRGWNWDLRRANVNLLPRVKWLLENGADKAIKDNDGLTPLDYATDPEMVALLSNWGASGGKLQD